MNTSEIRKLIGKVVKYRSNRTRQRVFQEACGEVVEVYKSEVYINGDWHNIDTFEILETYK